MRDTVNEGEPGDDDDGIPMTLLALNGNYWLYEGEELLNDLLFGTGDAPFLVRCVYFKDPIEVRKVFGADFVISTLWRINPDIIDRLRRDNLLVEEFLSEGEGG